MAQGRLMAGRRERGGFKFRPQTADEVRKQSEQNAGNFDSIFKQGFDVYRPQDGENGVRFCPPTWQNNPTNHYCLEIWLHYGVGARNQTYLCPKKMKGKPCAVCDASDDALRHGEKEDSDEMQAKRAYVAWIMDRDDRDNEGPKLWRLGWTTDRDINALRTDNKRGKVLQIHDPDNGYDVFFNMKKGKDPRNTKYFGFRIDREPSPLCEDDRDQDAALDFLQENPLPSVLKFYSSDYLEEAVSGTVGEDNDADDYDHDEKEDYDMVSRAKATKRGGKARDDEDERETRRTRSRDDDRDTGRRSTKARDEDEEEDEPKTRRGRARDEDEDEPPPRKARSRDEDEDEDRSTRRGRGKARDEDEDEEDRPVSKRARSKPRDEEEEDELPFDEDYDEENDDEVKGKDEDEEEDEDRGRAKKRVARRGNGNGRDDEDEPERRERGGRVKRTPPREETRKSGRSARR